MYINELTNKVMIGHMLDRHEGEFLAKCKGSDLMELFAGANKIRERFHGNKVDLCSVINSKSGNCPEDCRFCAQSSKYGTFVEEYPMMDKNEITKVARNALEQGAKRFCISTSGKRLTTHEVEKVCEAIRTMKEQMAIYSCATLGDLSKQELKMLKSAGLDRFHHNIETSEKYYPNICTTHTYKDRLETICAAQEVGLSTCVGVIIGMGESVNDWVDMAMAIREIDADSIPINYLMPIMGTPFEDIKQISPGDALKALSIFRYINPEKEIRVCGGRLSALQDLHSFLFFAGVDGMMIGNYLTRIGRDAKKDLELIKHLNMDVKEIL